MRWPCVLVLVAASAHANPALVWHAPAGCPDEPAVRAAIAQRLDVPVERIELAAEIEITASATGFTAKVATHGEGGEVRELTAASCSELTDAIEVVVARVASITPPPPPPPPPPPAPLAPPPLATPASFVIPPPRWDVGARLAGVSGIGVTPDLGIGGELAVWGRFDSAMLELAVERWAETTANVGSGNGVSVGFSGTTLRGGWHPATRPFRAWVAGERGSQRGTGFGFAMPARGEGRWSAIGVGGAYTYRLAPHLSALVAAEALGALERVSFVVDGTTAYRSPAYVLRAQLGIEFAWR